MKNIITGIKTNRNIQLGFMVAAILFAGIVISIISTSSGVNAKDIQEINKSLDIEITEIKENISMMDEYQKKELEIIIKDYDLVDKTKDVESLKVLKEKVIAFKNDYSRFVLDSLKGNMEAIKLNETANETEKGNLLGVTNKFNGILRDESLAFNLKVQLLNEKILEAKTILTSSEERIKIEKEKEVIVTKEASVKVSVKTSSSKEEVTAPTTPTKPAIIYDSTCFTYTYTDQPYAGSNKTFFITHEGAFNDLVKVYEAGDLYLVPGAKMVNYFKFKVPSGMDCSTAYYSGNYQR